MLINFMINQNIILTQLAKIQKLIITDKEDLKYTHHVCQQSISKSLSLHERHNLKYISENLVKTQTSIKRRK